jgi:hypothetical protein
MHAKSLLSAVIVVVVAAASLAADSSPTAKSPKDKAEPAKTGAIDSQAVLGGEPSVPIQRVPALLFYQVASPDRQWDTWLYQHEGTYYLYILTGRGGNWYGISMARSPDGVHWTDLGLVLRRADGVTWLGTGSTWKSPQFERDRQYYLNFSEWRGDRQTIFFAASPDLTHWTRLGKQYEFKQDERWYQPKGRWDCIWTIPRPGGGLLGYWTATPKPETGGQFGFGQSSDGAKWEALPPPKVEGVGEGEVGAVEKIGGQYYMLFGAGGKMVTLVADRPQGPFRAAARNREVLSGNTYFARFFPTTDGLLANHHTIAADGQVYFAPLKRAVVDKEGVLRLMWWKGNDALKMHAVALQLPTTATSPRPVMLDNRLDAKHGLVLEGTLTVPADTAAPVGLYLEHLAGVGVAIVVRHGGVIDLGPMRQDTAEFTLQNRVDRQAAFSGAMPFRLLLKGSLLEFYLNDQLMQCWRLPQSATGRIGLIRPQVDAIRDLKAWYCY